ncbi:toll/interleukin-1 receptor domain-containing protein [Streptomyces termitum]|uniref:TIR domain-containing protein n=1 Tax=Streptomyces termitum TaxID=67368 RepID=A0A918T7S6_9ACTN|nr:toll/interleukin-1 receptor domain-containing protein [Streptomyces termitum]GHB06112.1 hypothetical protein GCM10010305_56680 [Streptomyces termitum]
MNQIFVNYRTGDGEETATLVDRELSRVFGEDNVFRASKSIVPGSRFPQELLTAVRRSQVLVAVIGPGWTKSWRGEAEPGEGPEDWTRREIHEALETGAVVVPLLVGGVEPLRAEDLPAEIKDLAECQYRRLDHRNAAADLKRLVDDLVRLLPDLAASARRNGYEPAGEEARTRNTGADKGTVVKHRQRGGIGNVNGDFSGTFVSEPQGPVHTGSGHLYHAREQHLGDSFTSAGGTLNHVADNHGTLDQGDDRSGHPDGRR